MSLFEIVGLSLAVLFAYMTAVWLVSVAVRNASIVDVFWGLGFAVLAAVCFVTTDGFIGCKILITTVVTVWGMRLSLYILWWNWEGRRLSLSGVEGEGGEEVLVGQLLSGLPSPRGAALADLSAHIGSTVLRFAR